MTSKSPATAQQQQAAAELAQRHTQQQRGDRLPLSLRPGSIEDALQIQALVPSLLNETIAGWKCGIPCDGRVILAPIFASRVFRSESQVSLLPLQGMARIEPELAFILGQDLPPREATYGMQDVDQAVSACHIALELIGSRYLEPETAEYTEHLADGLYNQGCVLGPPLAAEYLRNEPSCLDIEIQTQAQTIQQLRGEHPAGFPRQPLYWLAEFLRSQGLGLRQGQFVITGSYAGSPDVPLQMPVSVRFVKLGVIHLQFTQG
ncbi:fumarylacetoacetate hydrolase family protein [Undibacterium rugosum]|uniref:Fumarylacetoacetate hydrolase family protein n=1 Tax=Undibacterium rugosum TaxID=2762291 RepID=A0A923KVZ9_9BURK|nr:fumarylacetoacetate hydrolase family protein [Undibacterium rugosum]MBC3935962.1 fumarylacetoacetate hydrolase family protein [Undibacterium rugosum]MBR7778704.1 fumarylacetoacetate hydrolase family protein [Undibacterium rugosum]